MLSPRAVAVQGVGFSEMLLAVSGLLEAAAPVPVAAGPFLPDVSAWS